jgi:hypothetical protein
MDFSGHLFLPSKTVTKPSTWLVLEETILCVCLNIYLLLPLSLSPSLSRGRKMKMTWNHQVLKIVCQKMVFLKFSLRRCLISFPTIFGWYLCWCLSKIDGLNFNLCRGLWFSQLWDGRRCCAPFSHKPKQCVDLWRVETSETSPEIVLEGWRLRLQHVQQLIN